MYRWKFGKNQTIGSQDIGQKRKCDTDANANIYTNEICTKNNMTPSP